MTFFEAPDRVESGGACARHGAGRARGDRDHPLRGRRRARRAAVSARAGSGDLGHDRPHPARRGRALRRRPLQACAVADEAGWDRRPLALPLLLNRACRIRCLDGPAFHHASSGARPEGGEVAAAELRRHVAELGELVRRYGLDDGVFLDLRHRLGTSAQADPDLPPAKRAATRASCGRRSRFGPSGSSFRERLRHAQALPHVGPSRPCSRRWRRRRCPPFWAATRSGPIPSSRSPGTSPGARSTRTRGRRWREGSSSPMPRSRRCGAPGPGRSRRRCAGCRRACADRRPRRGRPGGGGSGVSSRRPGGRRRRRGRRGRGWSRSRSPGSRSPAPGRPGGSGSCAPRTDPRPWSGRA